MPKVVDHDQRRAEIVQNARELIGERGLDAMTLRNLADRCGLANGGLRRYFPFKRDVLLALDEDVVRRFEEYAVRERYREQRGSVALRTLLGSVLPLDAERATTAEVYATLRDHALSDEVFAETLHRRLDQFFGLLVRHLQEAHDDGQLAGARSVEVTAAILVNAVVGIIMTSSIGQGRRLAQYDEALIKAILDTA